MMSGVVTLSAFVGFLAVTAWAWSRRNRARFDDASRLPLEDEAASSPQSRTEIRP